MSSKNENRILKNYFKIFNENFEAEYKNNLRTNKSSIDRNYTTSLSLNSLYECISKALYLEAKQYETRNFCKISTKNNYNIPMLHENRNKHFIN